jgi:hypothetical protein
MKRLLTLLLLGFMVFGWVVLTFAMGTDGAHSGAGDAAGIRNGTSAMKGLSTEPEEVCYG